jgi:hypothetical protein
MADGKVARIEIVQAVNIDTEMIGSDALAMEGIDAAGAAEEMASGHRVEPVLRERVLACQQSEPAFVDPDHQCVSAPANGTVACRELREVRLDLEADRAAVTASKVFPQRAIVHAWSIVEVQGD